MESAHVAVSGLEATQTIQFYRAHRHLNAATAEPDQSVPLIAGKPLAVRVYPDAHSDVEGDGWVEGELWYRGKHDKHWRAAPRFPGQVPAQAAHRIDRGNALHSLNYRLSGSVCTQSVDVRTRVWRDQPGRRTPSDWHYDQLRFVDVPPLQLKVYGVRLELPDLDAPPPTAAEMLQTFSFVRKTFPIADVQVLSYETLSFSGALCGASATTCRRAWSELLALLSRLQMANLSSVIHFALLPAGVPNRGYFGFGSARGVGASFAGNGPATAQEIGHALQLSHAPGGGVSSPDPDYPVYGSYPPGSIGEFGFDPVTGHVHSPKLCRDLMGYSGNHWVSPYTYRLLIERLQSKSLAAREVDSAATQPYLHLQIRINAEHHCKLDSTLMLRSTPMASPPTETDVRVELRDDRNNLLTVQTLRGPTWFHADEAGFAQSIPLMEGAKTMVIRCCGDHEPIVHNLSNRGLKLRLDPHTLPERGQTCVGVLKPRWELLCDRRGPVRVLVRYSCDGGATWRALNPGLKWNDCRIDLSCLPGGDDCRLQVIAWTPVQTVTAQSKTFQVTRKPRRASIATHVINGAGQSTVELFGAAHAPDGFASDEDLVWTSNLQGFLGRGARLTCYDLASGEHVITLQASDGLGGQTAERTRITVL